jgi:hypothetical protein
MRIVVAAILGLFIIPAHADDELEFCAVMISAPAGYIILHDGPGSGFGTRAKLVVDEVRTKYIKAVSCDLDWGYRDPPWPTLEALDTDPPPSGLNVRTRE